MRQVCRGVICGSRYFSLRRSKRTQTNLWLPSDLPNLTPLISQFAWEIRYRRLMPDDNTNEMFAIRPGLFDDLCHCRFQSRSRNRLRSGSPTTNAHPTMVQPI
jgi:hypothetical protein